MKFENLLKPLILVFSIFILFLSLITGDSIDNNLFRWVSGATGAVTLVYYAYEKYLWRKSVFKIVSELYGTPVLYGTWKGKIQFDADAAGNPGEIDIYVVVKQSLFTVSIRTFVEVTASISNSLCATIQKDASGINQLSYLYKSEAPYGKREYNRPHDGACLLNITKTPSYELNGAYFTERRGTGRIKLSLHNMEIAETLDCAKKMDFTSYK